MKDKRDLYIKIITNKNEEYCDLDYAGVLDDLIVLICYFIDDLAKNSNNSAQRILKEIELRLKIKENKK